MVCRKGNGSVDASVRFILRDACFFAAGYPADIFFCLPYAAGYVSRVMFSSGGGSSVADLTSSFLAKMPSGIANGSSPGRNG